MKKRQVTIKDIARQLKISHSTVSRALSPDRKVSALVNEKTRRRVQQTADQMNYSPNLMARGMVTHETGTLGLLTYQTFEESSQTDQILRAVSDHGYQIVMGVAADRFSKKPQNDQIHQIKQLLSLGIDGLLINWRGYQGEPERVADAVRGRMPVVTFPAPLPNLSAVVLDETTSFYEATEHLIRLGHERIGFIGSDWSRNRVGSAKAKGYFLAMQKHGLTPKRIHARGFLLAESGYRLRERLRDGTFTALVCRNNYTTIGVCRGLRESGIRVPEDVAVVGNGGMEVAAYLTPALTTLSTPYEAIAQAAMELMLEQLEGQETPRQITLKSSLIVRESCGANKPK